MQLLEGELRRLEAEYNQFFAGRLARMPHQTRARVDALVKQQDRVPLRNTAERFRFESLQARFSAFCELWDRTLKAREDGRAAPISRVRGGPAAMAPPPPTDARNDSSAAKTLPSVAASATRPATVVDGLVAEERFDSSTDPARVRELHARLNQVRTAAGETPVPYERFATLISSQVAKLARQGETVALRVAVKDGKISVTAKPVRKDDGE